jgi:hypothetical protein
MTVMNNQELKEMMIRSLNMESDPEEVSKSLESAGVHFDFSEGFLGKVIDRIYSAGTAVVRDTEFVRNLTFVFYRIALPGVAAIIILLLSIFLMEGSFSLNSLLGLGSNNEESIICLLTGN